MIKRNYINILGLAVLIAQCCGFAMGILGANSALESFLFHSTGNAELRALDLTLAFSTIALSIVFVRYNSLKIALAIASIFLLDAMCVSLVQGVWGYQFSVGVRLVRVILPIGLYYLRNSTHLDGFLDAPLPKWDSKFSLLKFGIGVTFIIHGSEALLGHPQFQDYLIKFFREWLAIDITPDHAMFFLYGIGIVDIILGLWIFLSVRWLIPILTYMAFWGLLTAYIRIDYFGIDVGLSMTLIRAANGGVPLILLLAIKLATEQRDQTAESTLPVDAISKVS